MNLPAVVFQSNIKTVKGVHETYRPTKGEQNTLLKSKVDTVFSEDHIGDEVPSDTEFGKRFKDRYIGESGAVCCSQETANQEENPK